MIPSLDLISLIFVTLSIVLVNAQNSELWPAAYPLAVRSPYLQAWESSMNGSHPTTNWPTFWSNQVCTRLCHFQYIQLTLFQIVGWAGYIRIDGQSYRWLGDVGTDGTISTPAANLTSRQVTPTRSIFTMQAGPMNLNATFLSPIEVSTNDETFATDI